MKTEFSSRTREQWFSQLNTEQFDLIVIGGGITGAGIFLDATSRGIKTLLVEMQDFAGGTSSRSTKLIHGGIRYLKQRDFKLVAEVGKERATVRNLARHLVHPLPIIVPIYKGGSMKKWELRLGMWVFEWLVKMQARFLSKGYSKQETLQREPSLTAEGLVGSVKYYENRTDDARLTIELIKKGVELGGKALNYVKAEEFIFDDQQKIVGIKLKDVLTESITEARSKHVISATGPWVDAIREVDDLLAEHKLVLTKGIHLVFKNERFPINNAVYFDTPDQRMVFAVPTGNVTYIGTTDTFYKGDIQNPDITEEDINYILTTIQFKFPDLKITKKDIISSWSGLRPLINEPGKNPSEISRKDEVFISKSGLISIAGGKLTGYRKMAQKATDIVAKLLHNIAECTTASIKLTGGEFTDEQAFLSAEKQTCELALTKGLTIEEGKWLFSKYGSESNIVLNGSVEDTTLPTYIALALAYSKKHEMVMKNDDFSTRRSGFAFFEPENEKLFLNKEV